MLLDGPVRPYDFRWPRLARPGEGCGFHCDGPYMSRGTDRHLSAWIPLGRVDPHEGALMILEDSHRSEELAERLPRRWTPTATAWCGSTTTPQPCRSATAAVADRHFEPGDVLIFAMNLLHGAFDNESPDGRCRLSTDSRYLVAGETPDPRWNGDD